MKTIGFIDLFIDEWHANHYPTWIRESPLRGDWDVALVWAERNREGGVSTDDWCAHFGVRRAKSLQEVVDTCDALVILSPDNPERHEDLSVLAATCQKPVYIDKTFAPDLATARRIFERFEKGGTPMFSSSALRFAEEFDAMAEKGLAAGAVHSVTTRGPGVMARYGIHQVEMMVALMGLGITRVLVTGAPASRHYVFEYEDGRRGQMSMINGVPFQIGVQGPGGDFHCQKMKDVFFKRFIDQMLMFFSNPKAIPVPRRQTLQIISAIEAALRAEGKSETWFPVTPV